MYEMTRSVFQNTLTSTSEQFIPWRTACFKDFSLSLLFTDIGLLRTLNIFTGEGFLKWYLLCGHWRWWYHLHNSVGLMKDGKNALRRKFAPYVIFLNLSRKCQPLCNKILLIVPTYVFVVNRSIKINTIKFSRPYLRFMFHYW